jgi:asparagine synthase (glutamine-hydrolysing)
MCGISGIISKNKLSVSLIKQMNDKISHRGPDDEGFLLGGDINYDIELDKTIYVDNQVSFTFGHRRLSIVDLSPLGHQPMSYIDRYWIIFNGEIYNHIELREELVLKGYKFKSNTDTEVIMASYDYWGKDCLNKFNGMWSFVLIDNTNNEIFISRDRFGVKPLYYFQDDEYFIFGSEIKSIIINPIIDVKQNIDFCTKYIENGCNEHTTDTAFLGVKKFDFGCYHHSKLEDIFHPLNEIKFWKVSPNLSNEKFDFKKANEYANKYYDILNDAVKIRLRADVKVGSASSGGLDSSSIVYLINQQLKALGKQEKQETFSTVYKSVGTENCDESIFIDEITNKLNVISNQIEPSEYNVPFEHDKVIYHLENPPESTLMSSWHTFKLVSSSGVKVTLDGQGADEQLAGYLPYIINYWATKNLNIKIFKELNMFNKTNTLKYSLYGLALNLSSKIIGKKFSNFIASKFSGKEVDMFQNLNQRLHNDSFSHLVTLIHYADHTSMAHSIESRMPFMDYRLVEFLSSVPSSYKIHNGWTKYIARLAFDKKLPDTITWRKDKMGWPIPQDKWFKGSLKEWFENGVRKGINIAKHKQPSDIFSINKSKAVRYLNLGSFYNKFIYK